MQEKILYYLTPIVKVALFIFFLIVCLVPIWLITSFDFIQIDEKSFSSLLFSEVGLSISVISALLMTFRIFRSYDFDRIFITKEGSLEGFGYGSLIGFALIIACSGLAFLNGNVSFSLAKIDTALFFGYLLLYISVAICEELIFRGFVLVVLAERYPTAFAIFLTSCLFGLAHIGNEGFTMLAMLNISLAGALFSILILQRRNMSWAIGLHFGWNFTQGNLLGYEVSGSTSPGLLKATPKGHHYLSGGVFGIESSIFCTIILTVIIAFLLVKYRFKLSLTFVES